MLETEVQKCYIYVLLCLSYFVPMLLWILGNKLKDKLIKLLAYRWTPECFVLDMASL